MTLTNQMGQVVHVCFLVLDIRYATLIFSYEVGLIEKHSELVLLNLDYIFLKRKFRQVSAFPAKIAIVFQYE